MPSRCTCASTNASLAASIATHLLVAKGAHLDRVDRPARWRVTSTDLLSGTSGSRVLAGVWLTRIVQ